MHNCHKFLVMIIFTHSFYKIVPQNVFKLNFYTNPYLEWTYTKSPRKKSSFAFDNLVGPFFLFSVVLFCIISVHVFLMNDLIILINFITAQMCLFFHDYFEIISVETFLFSMVFNFWV